MPFESQFLISQQGLTKVRLLGADLRADKLTAQAPRLAADVTQTQAPVTPVIPRQSGDRGVNDPSLDSPAVSQMSLSQKVSAFDRVNSATFKAFEKFAPGPVGLAARGARFQVSREVKQDLAAGTFINARAGAIDPQRDRSQAQKDNLARNAEAIATRDRHPTINVSRGSQESQGGRGNEQNERSSERGGIGGV